MTTSLASNSVLYSMSFHFVSLTKGNEYFRYCFSQGDTGRDNIFVLHNNSLRVVFTNGCKVIYIFIKIR